MRLVFMGSPPFATPVLMALLASSHQVQAVVTRPDRPRGRGRKIEVSQLVELAHARGLAVLQPQTTRDPEFVARLRALAPEVLLVASYGEILRQELLELGPHGALNVHASLLPRYRGAAPIQSAILAGDAETGVTIQRMVLALDEGDVLLSERTPIDAHENSGALLERLAQLGGRAAVQALDLLASGAARFTPQDATRATYARKIRKEDGRIDWTQSAPALERFVRAMTPWPGARTRAPLAHGGQASDGHELVVLEARAVADVKASALGATHSSSASPGTQSSHAALRPGTVLQDHKRFVVATGDGALEIRMLKPAGKCALEAAAWLRGARLAADARLGA